MPIQITLSFNLVGMKLVATYVLTSTVGILMPGNTTTQITPAIMRHALHAILVSSDQGVGDSPQDPAQRVQYTHYILIS